MNPPGGFMCRRKLTKQKQVSTLTSGKAVPPKKGVVFPGINRLKISPNPEGTEASYSVSVTVLEVPL